MRLARTRSVTLAATAVLALAGCTSAAVAETPAASGVSSAPVTPVHQTSPVVDVRGEAAMPERISEINYRYAQALMQLPTEELEPTYMGEIVVHHRAVIEMAEVALEKAQHPELKTLARAIIASQTEQIEGFTMLLEGEYGLTPEQAREQAPEPIRLILPEVNQGLDEKVATIREAPADPEFDRVWMSEVIPHHQVAILESQPVQNGADTPELVLMANMAIGGQEMQIVQMLNWLVQWYGN